MVERRRANRLYCIPAVWARILEASARADVSSLREVDTGTSATPPELIEALKERNIPLGDMPSFGDIRSALLELKLIEPDESKRTPGQYGPAFRPVADWAQKLPVPQAPMIAG